MEIPNDIKRFIQHQKKEIDQYYCKDEKIIFQKIKIPQGNLYLIYNNEITIIYNKISSYTIKPIGLITELNNEDYIYYNFNNNYNNTAEIVEKFIENKKF